MSEHVCPLEYRYGRQEMESIFTESSRIRYQKMTILPVSRHNDAGLSFLDSLFNIRTVIKDETQQHA